MTNEKQLKGAFLALSETLLWRFGPAPTGELRERRLKTIAYLSAVAGRVTNWKALAARRDDYASTISVLDGATAAVALARSDAERLLALDEADAALVQTSEILDAVECGCNVGGAR